MSSSNGASAAITQKYEDPAKVIKFGSTKFSDYSKCHLLGKGTYGEVFRCIHIASGIECAMKTFLFEVNNILA